MTITDRLTDILREYREYLGAIREVEGPTTPPPQCTEQCVMRPADQQRASRAPIIANADTARRSWLQ